MKKLMLTATMVAIAMIGFIAVLWILPCNKQCCHKGNDQCEMREGCDDHHGGTCATGTETSDGHGHVRKEIRMIIGDSSDCQMMVNGKSCPMDEQMNSGMCGDQVMNSFCCCCCMRMHGGEGMCGGRDSMHVEMKIDTIKKIIKVK